jgi:glycosyltransferase involved in cell wall biosynthesis
LCIVIPAYNEALTIANTVRAYKAEFPNAALVVVDNNSTDKTADAARGVLSEGCDFLLFERRQGKGAAVRKALGRIAADIYILADADATYAAEDAARLLARLERDRCDMVVGDRLSGGAYARQNARAGHSFGNGFLSWVVSLLAGQTYSDVLSGLRVLSRPFVNMLDVRSFGFQLEAELNLVAAYVRADVVEVPITYAQRPEGSQSKLHSIRDGFRIAGFALINWIAFFPLQSFGAVAAVALAIAAVLGFKIFAIYFELGAMPYSATAVAVAAAGLVAIQSLFAGLMLRIVTRANRRTEVARLLDMRREWNARLDGQGVPS